MRSQTVADWLARSDWGRWQRMPLTGDASARRYERLMASNGETVILMDADPVICGGQTRFVAIADHIRAIGLRAPEVLAFDDALGLVVLSDLGETDFAHHLRDQAADEQMLYEAAVDVLTQLQSAPPPDGLTMMTAEVGTQMIDLAFEWAATDASEDLRVAISTGLHAALASTESTAPVLSLRDFHAENLIWRGGRAGADRVGLLDFQDAFLAHPMYDLASLLRDARRDVDAGLTQPLIARLDGVQDHDEAQRAFHIIAVQRNLRILGIFNRLARRDGKTHYLSFIPRVWVHLQTDLASPALAPLAPLITRAFTPKDP